ncbi:MAG: hypothetical protein PUE01_12140 [Clostridiaceae bacterium]|nr:hypothetical protein [Clostridiaceae bacterium]
MNITKIISRISIISYIIFVILSMAKVMTVNALEISGIVDDIFITQENNTTGKINYW